MKKIQFFKKGGKDGAPKKEKRPLKERLKYFNQRRFKYGSLATVITIVFIAIVVLANVMASMLLERFPVKIDLTPEGIFSISQQSIDYLKKLDKDVEVTVLANESTLSTSSKEAKQVVEVINKYAQYTDKIKIKYVDPDKNPQVMSEFNNLYKGDLSSKFVVLRCGDKVRALEQSDLVNYQSNDYYSSSYTITSTAEKSMTSAIMNITDANPMKATILTGESVADVSALKDLLQTNGYDVEEVDILTGTIDQTSSLVVLNSPLSDLNDEQITKLDNFLSNDGKLGKNLLYVAAYGQKSTPKLDAFLAEWGLQVDTGYVMDSDNKNLGVVSSGVYGIYIKPDNTDYTADLQNADLPVMVIASRPIRLLFESNNMRTTTSLLKTADTGYVIPDDATESTDLNSLPKEAVNVMAMGSKYVYDEDNKKSTSNVLVLGSGYILDKNLVQSASLNNGDYVLNAVNKMTGKTTSISIVSKDLTQEKLSMTASQMAVVRNVVIFLIPLAFIITGIIIWARRRNR